MTSRNTSDSSLSPSKQPPERVPLDDEQERPLASDRRRRHRLAVDQPLVAERPSRPRQADADAAVAADEHAVDRAVDDEIERRRRVARPLERLAALAARVASRGEQSPQREGVEGAKRGHPPDVPAVRGAAGLELCGRRGGVVAVARCRRAERVGEIGEMAAQARGGDRREAALDRERRRVVAQDQRGEIRRAEEQDRARLRRPGGRRVRSAVDERDLAQRLSRPRLGELQRALPGQPQRQRHPAVDDHREALGLVALVPQDLARLDGAAPHEVREPGEVRVLQAREQRGRRQEPGGVGDQTSRSSVSYSSTPETRRAVRREYSGTSSQLEVSSVSGSEAMSSERGGPSPTMLESPSLAST